MSDSKKLLNIYISEIVKNNGTKNVELIQRLLKKEFNYSVSINEIKNSIEPNVIEMRADIIQQCNNLGIRYG